MNQLQREALKRRRDLIDQLSASVIETARPLIDPDTDSETLKKTAQEISERIQFETNLAINEVVTRYASRKVDEKEIPKERTFQRFGKNFRAQHMLMFASVIILIVTGMPLKFPELGISKFIIVNVFGGFENSTTIHRIGAVGLIIVGVWHLFYAILSRIGRRDFFLMIPKLQDIKDFFVTIGYYLGRRKSGPKFGRFSFIEKFDYWAVYWGMVIMIGSGLIMWFKEMFPKFMFDIGREMHSDEGLLATLAIIVWHFYNVHFNPESFPMSWVWWHGRLSEKEMKHHHPLEYAEIIETERNEIEESSDETGQGE